jgi:CBS domain-containing protein
VLKITDICHIISKQPTLLEEDDSIEIIIDKFRRSNQISRCAYVVNVEKKLAGIILRLKILSKSLQ